jgi:hypothetical protein
MTVVIGAAAPALEGESGDVLYPLFARENDASDAGVAFLQRRELEWSYGLVSREFALKSLQGATSEDRLLSIFDIFHEWFQREDYESCAIITVMLDMAGVAPMGQERLNYLSDIRSHLTSFATDVHFADPEGFAMSWHVLMKGAIFAAVEGDAEAALRGKSMARTLLLSHATRAALADDEQFDFAIGAMPETPVVLRLAEIGDDLMEYEDALRWIEERG